jgi:transaldolase
MPAATMEAFADHGDISSGSGTRRFAEPAALFEALGEVGIDMDDVFAQLEREGVAKFDTAWNELIAAVGAQLASR